MKKDKITAGLIGAGARGAFLLDKLCALGDVEVIGVCDEYEDRRGEAATKASEAMGKPVPGYGDYRRLLEKKPDCVVIATSWDTHISIAVDAMEAGVIPGIECGGASSVNEVWRLVRACESTGVRMAFLENCCYGHEETTLLNMVNMGVFGELLHCEGGYQHDCRALAAGRIQNRQARFENTFQRCAEIYPSHELGPIMKYLGINHGNRIMSLNTMASKAVGLKEYCGEAAMQGDICTTFLRCANGETILLTYDVSLPRPYSRGGRIDGTKGVYSADKNALYIEGTSPSEQWEDFSAYLEDPRYEHPMWREYRESGSEAGGHGGMDYMVVRDFIDCVEGKCPPYLDVYDAAVITAVTALSEQSAAVGGKTVLIPDFTDGKWIKR